MAARQLIVLEFNELSPSLMYRFMSAGMLPNFARCFSHSLVYTTEARERAPYLDPWIQWVTVHTGLNHDRHQIDKLNEGHTCEVPRLWDVVSRHGGTVWVCGSMSTNHEAGMRGALIPDPWTTKVQPTAEYEHYFEFVQAAVLNSTNRQARLQRRQALPFLAFLASHGLSLRTVRAIVSQLWSERGGHHRWRRAVVLDRLQFDVFRHYWQRERPSFSTLFLNSTAHFQHLHWREMEPELFEVKPSEEDRAEYAMAILHGYQCMDALLGETLQMSGPDTTVVLATALSQQPCLTYEEQGGKQFYRPHDFPELLRFAGADGVASVAPVMAHQFHVEFVSEDASRRGEERLRALNMNGRPILAVEREAGRAFAWCAVTTEVPPSAILRNADGVERGFFEMLYKVEGIKSGMHHPDGILWIRRPTAEHQVFDEKVPLDRVAPTLLAELEIPAPPWMTPVLLPGVASRR